MLGSFPLLCTPTDALVLHPAALGQGAFGALLQTGAGFCRMGPEHSQGTSAGGGLHGTVLECAYVVAMTVASCGGSRVGLEEEDLGGVSR